MPSENFHSATIPQDRLLPGIHGLRGIAALSVVLFHLVHLANIAVPQSFTFIASNFGNGVHLFFVLSAFSLMHSTEHTMQRPTWATDYFIKRFWRIAPLFYCVIAVMTLFPVIVSRVWSVDIEKLLLNLTFTFGFTPWKGIVWAGWTIGVEMLFYAILPVLLLTVRTMTATLALLLASLLVSYIMRSSLHFHYEHTLSQYGYNWSYFSFGSNLCFFAMGMYAFRLTRNFSVDALKMQRLIPLFSVILLGMLMFTGLDKPLKGIGRIDLMVWGLAFAALCIWQSTRPSLWCANRFLEYTGERSYSIYLLHPMIIVFFKTPIRQTYDIFTPYIGAYAFFICGLLIIALILVLSEIAYRMVEIPGIRYGKQIIKKRKLQYGL